MTTTKLQEQCLDVSKQGPGQSYKMCIYPKGSDIFISDSFRSYGSFEPDISATILAAIKAYPGTSKISDY